MKEQRVTLAKKRVGSRVCMFIQITNLITPVELLSSFTFNVSLTPPLYEPLESNNKIKQNLINFNNQTVFLSCY